MLTRDTSRTYDYNDYRKKEKYSERVDVEGGLYGDDFCCEHF